MFSSQPASESNQLSYGFTRVLVETLAKIIPFDIETSTVIRTFGELNHYIRKFAHFTIYLVLGILVYKALIKNKLKSRVFLISFLICATYAATDELHQLFVPGRGCQLRDVFIDSAGSILGISISELLHRVRKAKFIH